MHMRSFKLRVIQEIREVPFNSRFRHELRRRIKNEISAIGLFPSSRSTLLQYTDFGRIPRSRAYSCSSKNNESRLHCFRLLELLSVKFVLQENIHVVITRNSALNFNFMSSEYQPNAVFTTT